MISQTHITVTGRHPSQENQQVRLAPFGSLEIEQLYPLPDSLIAHQPASFKPYALDSQRFLSSVTNHSVIAWGIYAEPGHLTGTIELVRKQNWQPEPDRQAIFGKSQLEIAAQIMSEDQIGRGIGTLAAMGVIEYAMAWWHISTIVASVSPANKASEKWANKLGLSLFGTADVPTQFVNGDTYALRQWALANEEVQGRIANLGMDSGISQCLAEGWDRYQALRDRLNITIERPDNPLLASQ